MSFEMSCANCDGRMIVDTLGIVVACPHCGTHLSIPAEIPGLSDSPVDPVPPALDDEKDDDGDSYPQSTKSTWIPDIQSEDTTESFPEFSPISGTAHDLAASESNILVSESEVRTESEVPSALRVANPDPSSVMPAIVTDVKQTEPVSGFPVISDPNRTEGHKAAVDSKVSESDIQSLAGLVAGMEPATTGSAPNILTGDSVQETGIPHLAGASAADSSPGLIALDQPAGAPESQAASSSSKEKSDPKPSAKPIQKPQPYDSVYSSRRGKVVPNPVFQAWLSYTILLTAGLAMAIYYIFTAPTSNLESLPDVKPVENVRQLVPEKAKMPPGHTLELNQTQRFGNIEVTPVKVTQGPLVLIGRDYVEESRKIQKVGTVLKLWLKFKNVSQDQTIAPLDNDLLFYRNPDPKRKAGVLANNFLCPADQKSEQGHLVWVYDHNVDDDYDLKGQQLGAELEPGEETLIYIPTENSGWDKLQGPLIWRVHFRKGYSPKNYGVTTIFEVAFPSDAIESDASNA